MLRDFFVKLGLNFAKSKVSDTKIQHDIKAKLEAFVNRKLGENYNCSLKEEIDFEGLVEYISNDFLDDIEKRLFGNNKERRTAHKNIVDKAVSYAQAKTSLSRKRATKLISDAMCILRDFYKKRVNKELLLVAAEMEDAILDEMSAEHEEQTKVILKRLDEIEATNLATKEVVSVDKGLEMIGRGQISAIEAKLTEFTKAISAGHVLFPYYGFQLNAIDGKTQYQSVPLSKDAIKEYPPSVKCLGTVRLGEGYIKQLTTNEVDYANRHQLPIVIDVKKAEKYLGNVLDPIQRDAEELIGEEITIPPKPFPPAFPCAIKLDDETVFDYILFRTKEILDDDTIVISNYEQKNYPYKIMMNMHPENKTIDFSFQKSDIASNEESLKYANVIKKANSGTKITIKLLETDEIFAEGNFNNFNYEGSFSTIEEEIDFFARIISIEKYFKKVISIPQEIYQRDWDAIVYISDLLRGETCYGEWERFIFTFTVSNDLKRKIANTEDKAFNLSLTVAASVPLWDETYELQIVRTFIAGKFEDLENLKKDIKEIKIGESIEVSFVTTEEFGKLQDVLNNGDEGI